MTIRETVESLYGPAHRRADGMHVWDGMAMEREYAELLAQLVLNLRPERVLETGTGRGVTSAHIGAALRANGTGTLRTMENDQRYARHAERKLEGLPVFVTYRAWSVWDNVSVEPYDLVILDSGPTTRRAEIEYWLRHARGLVAVHDANRRYLPAGHEYPLHLGREILSSRRGDGLWLGYAGKTTL